MCLTVCKCAQYQPFGYCRKLTWRFYSFSAIKQGKLQFTSAEFFYYTDETLLICKIGSKYTISVYPKNFLFLHIHFSYCLRSQTIIIIPINQTVYFGSKSEWRRCWHRCRGRVPLELGQRLPTKGAASDKRHFPPSSCRSARLKQRTMKYISFIYHVFFLLTNVKIIILIIRRRLLGAL